MSGQESLRVANLYCLYSRWFRCTIVFMYRFPPAVQQQPCVKLHQNAEPLFEFQTRFQTSSHWLEASHLWNAIVLVHTCVAHRKSLAGGEGEYYHIVHSISPSCSISPPNSSTQSSFVGITMDVV